MGDQNDSQLDTEVHLEPDEPAATTTSAATGPLVVLMQPALQDLQAHAAGESDHEIGGVLVGSVVDGARQVVIVEAAIRGTNMTQGRANVTFTHETWSEINRVKDSEYPDLKIVGWYHSHPGFGLFLSEYDLFIHRNFFSAAWQIAVVTDPLAAKWGCFTWQSGQIERESAAFVATAEHVAGPPAAPSTPQMAAPLPTPFTTTASPALARERGLMWAGGLLALLLTVLIGLVLSSWADGRAARQQIGVLDQQVNRLSHEVTALRDVVQTMDEGRGAIPTATPNGGLPSTPSAGVAPGSVSPTPISPGAPSP